MAVLHQFAAACHADIEFGDLLAQSIAIDAQKVGAFRLISGRRIQRNFDQRQFNLAQYPVVDTVRRQLENILKRLLVTSNEPEITGAELEAALGGMQAAEPARAGIAEGEWLSASVARHLKRYFDLHNGQLPPAGVYDRIMREVELPLIEIALDATAGNQAKCADLLGINRNTLRKKITDLDIRVTRRRKLM